MSKVIANRSRRLNTVRLMVTASSLSALATASPTAAQAVPSVPADPAGPPTATAAPAALNVDPAPAETAAEDIVVTGSRLRRSAVAGSSPVNTLGADALAAKGTLNVQDAVNELPQLGITQGNRTQGFNTLNSGFSTGGDFVNLRNLGTQRTLVLVNNRRFVGGDPGTSSVDLNVIPTLLVDRIEVVTGAASAVYGADAVSGVVNVTLKNKVSGVQIDGRSGVSSRGDAQQYQLGLLAGTSFAQSRGSVLVAGEYSKEKGFLGADRSFGQNDPLNFTIASGNGSAAIANDLITNNGRTFAFDTNNNLVPSNTLPISITRFQRAPHRNLSLPQERVTLGGTAHFDAVESDTFSVTAFVEGNYAHSYSVVSQEPRLEQFTGSPLLYTSIDTPSNEPRVPATNPYARALIPIIGAIPAAGLTVQTRLSEFPAISTDVTRDTFRIAGGLRGKLPARFTYELYYQYGQLRTKQKDNGAFNRLRLAQTINVNDNGTPLNYADDTCANATAVAQGCVPFNFFGQPGTASPALLNYLLIDSVTRTKASQSVVSGYVTGPLLTLPAGDVAVVLGGEYRRESATITPDLTETNGANSLRFLVGLPTSSYDVKEAFGELTVPVIGNVPLIRRFEIGGAGRYSKYSTVGSKFSWSVRGDWEVVPDFRFRAVYSTAVRAPNLKELYSPASSVSVTLVDPCDTVAENGSAISRSATRGAACTADLGAAAVGFNQTQSQSQLVSSTVSGNPALDAEKARTLTLGAVFTPTFLRGLSVTSDYYHIRIDNVISTLSLQDVVNQCYDEATRPQQFCSLITRDPTTRQILNVQNGTFNASTETVAGVDTRAEYRTSLNQFGLLDTMLDVSGGWSRLIKHDFLARAGATVDRRVGQVGDFKNRYDAQVGLRKDGLGIVYQVRVYSSAVADTTIAPDSALATLNHIPAVTYHDVQFYIDVADKRFRLAFGVKNLLDKQPPIITSPARTADALAPTVSGIYDTRGRFFYTTAALKF